MEVAESLTVALLIPAGAGIVIAGRIPPNMVEGDGPLTELSGYFGPKGLCECLEIGAITLCRNALFLTLYTGLPVCENHIRQQLLRSAKVWAKLQETLPNIVTVYSPPEADKGFTVWFALHNVGEVGRLAVSEYVGMCLWSVTTLTSSVPRQPESTVPTYVRADRGDHPPVGGDGTRRYQQGQRGAPARLGVVERPRMFKAGMRVDDTHPLGIFYEQLVVRVSGE